MPVLDSVFGAVFAAESAILLANPSDFGGAEQNKERQKTLVGGAFWVGLFGISAYVGFSRTHRCREAIDAFVPAPEPQLPGAEGQTCHPTAGCQHGLTCLSDLCVRFVAPAPMPASVETP